MPLMRSDNAGRVLLRLTVAGTVLLHGIAKLGGGVAGISGLLTKVGMPAYLGYAVFIGEILGPILMIVGWYARIGALLVAGNMVVAILLVHSRELFTLNEQGGWALELQALMLFGALASMLLGPGRPAVNDR